ncbi:MAG TPA: hypothetical protein PKE40_06445, partial [Arachnia sp.]|nr:hypothetical protein [Arachnia sp.]HMT85976.1 hypothetical protein [Arachnia sp.]
MDLGEKGRSRVRTRVRAPGFSLSSREKEALMSAFRAAAEERSIGGSERPRTRMDRDRLIYGSAYYDEHLPVDRIGEDVAMMKAANHTSDRHRPHRLRRDLLHRRPRRDV